MTLKVSQGHRKWCESTGNVSLPIGGLQEGIQFRTTVEVTGHMHALRLLYKHTVVNTRYISRGTGVRKVLNSYSDLQGYSR